MSEALLDCHYFRSRIKTEKKYVAAITATKQILKSPLSLLGIFKFSECLTVHINDEPWNIIGTLSTFGTLCAILYHLSNFINIKNTHGGVILSVNVQTEACNFTNSITPPWVFFTFFELYTWYKIAQNMMIKLLSNH